MTRYYLIPALAIVLSLGACSKKDANDSPSTGSGKKGADFSTNMQYGT